ncbi:MAG TPA: ligase-associated DNA damage response exonuclease [Stellaceae bacterium]|nr:ligase-associated DNA damage response exonuclease [Stellaceae bacterium]
MHPTVPAPETWLKPTPAGLYCEPADFFIDPSRKSDRAVITHGHADHARPGHRSVLATTETLAFMAHRYGDAAGAERQALRYGETLSINGVSLRLLPAGHILGSAQVALEYRGSRAIVSGDYKRRRDPTCAPFAPESCDVFVTEATFALPVFRHPPDREEIARLLHSLSLFSERCHLVGVYSLGKCQRVIALLREAGFDEMIYLHGALEPCCAIYQEHGVALGPLAPVAGAHRDALKGKLVLAPPGFEDRWLRRFPEPLTAMASGWMRVRQRAKQWGVELPLVISDHADWDELNVTIAEVGAPEVWVTHGREEALIRQATLDGFRARALSLTGFEEEC